MQTDMIRRRDDSCSTLPIMPIRCRQRARAQQTDADMAAATFCLCPPGATQDSTRMWRALLRGCIPVTFFRANDLPFARHLGIAYSDFVVNLQPDDVGRTQARGLARAAGHRKRLSAEGPHAES